MSIDIRLKHSATANKAPQPADLKDGELALNTNTASPAAYIKDSAGNIVKLAGAGAIGGTPASETAAGIAELATQAEVTAGTDDQRIVTPLKLATAVPAASETAAGKVELATAAETTTGTDDTRAVHPAGLKVELDKKVDLAGDTMTGDLNLPNLVATGDIQSTSQNGGPLAGFRNLLINGNFRVMQRENASQNVQTHGNSGYTMDRWITDSNSTTGRRLLGDGTPIAEVFGSNDTYMLQGVELYNSAFPTPGVSYTPFRQGSTWTLSYYCDSAPTSVGQVVEFRNNANDGTAASNPQPVTGVPLPTATGESIGTLIRYSTTFTINAQPAADSSCLVFHISGSDTSVNRFAYAQLEPGPVASPYEHRPIATELALCQRFYQTRSSGTVNAADLRPTMRATPTVSGNNYDAEL